MYYKRSQCFKNSHVYAVHRIYSQVKLFKYGLNLYFSNFLFIYSFWFFILKLCRSFLKDNTYLCKTHNMQRSWFQNIHEGFFF